MQAFIIINSQFGMKSFKLLWNTICYILNILNIYLHTHTHTHTHIYIWFFIFSVLRVICSGREHFLSFECFLVNGIMTVVESDKAHLLANEKRKKQTRRRGINKILHQRWAYNYILVKSGKTRAVRLILERKKSLSFHNTK